MLFRSDEVQLSEGDQEVEFNAANLPSGVYFYRISATVTANADGDDVGTITRNFSDVKKMMLLK